MDHEKKELLAQKKSAAQEKAEKSRNTAIQGPSYKKH